MTRILFLGNSHVACVRDAQDRYAGRLAADLDISVIGAHQSHLLDTDVTGGILRPATAEATAVFDNLGLPHETDLNAQDAICIVGCGMALSRAAFMYKNARTFSFAAVSGDPDLATASYSLISDAAFGAMLQAGLLQTLAGQLFRHLRRGTDRPIYIASQPRTTTGIRGMEDHSLSVLNTLIDNGDAPLLSAIFDDHASVLCRAMGGQFLPQPPQTIADDVLTSDTFTKGAIRLANGRFAQPADDILHANAAYGALIIEQMRQALTA